MSKEKIILETTRKCNKPNLGFFDYEDIIKKALEKYEKEIKRKK